jgi:hypothetical protein
LINDQTGQTFDFGREVSYYHDSDGSEGSRNNSVIVPSVPSGQYYLRVEPEMARDRRLCATIWNCGATSPTTDFSDWRPAAADSARHSRHFAEPVLKPRAGARAIMRPSPVPTAEVTIEYSIIRDLWRLLLGADRHGRISRLELVQRQSAKSAAQIDPRQSGRVSLVLRRLFPIHRR